MREFGRFNPMESDFVCVSTNAFDKVATATTISTMQAKTSMESIQ
jgi:hypothetical protein